MKQYISALTSACLMMSVICGALHLAGLRGIRARDLREMKSELSELRGTVAELRDELAVEQIEKALLWRRKVQSSPQVAEQDVKGFVEFLKLEATKEFVKRGMARREKR